MLFRRKRQVWLNVLFPLVLVGARHCFASFFIGVGKVILLVLIASLLMFLVVRSADICRQLTACLQALGIYLIAPAAHPAPSRPPSTTITIPRTPQLPLRFQLPPPISC